MNDINLETPLDERVDLHDAMLITAQYYEKNDNKKEHAKCVADAVFWLDTQVNGIHATMDLTCLLSGSIYADHLSKQLKSAICCPKTGLKMLSSSLDIDKLERILELFHIGQGLLLETIKSWKERDLSEITLNWYEKLPEQSVESYAESDPYHEEESPLFEIIPYETVCSIDASGFTYTLDAVYDWATAVVNTIKEDVGTDELQGHIRAYREQDSDWLCFTIWRETKAEIYDVVFLLGEPHDFDLSDPYVPDISEALHMIGIVTQALNLKIEVGGSRNETNKYCTPDEWRENQTNAPLKLLN